MDAVVREQRKGKELLKWIDSLEDRDIVRSKECNTLRAELKAERESSNILADKLNEYIMTPRSKPGFWSRLKARIKEGAK